MVLDPRLRDLYTRAVEHSGGWGLLAYNKVNETRIDGHVRRLEDERRTQAERKFAELVKTYIKPMR